MPSPLQTSTLQTVKDRLLLLRHGQAGDQAHKRYIGQTQTELTPYGEQQARAWARHLAALPIARIVCSDLSRCLVTAGTIASDMGREVQSHPALREIHLGQWEGLTFDQVRSTWPDAFQRRGHNLATFRPPGGESFADLQSRVVPVMRSLLFPESGNTLVVGHAGVIRVTLCHFLGLDLDRLFVFGQDHGNMSILEARPGPWPRLVALNLLPDIS